MSEIDVLGRFKIHVYVFKIHVCTYFKHVIWADQIHLQSFETLIFHDRAFIRLQVYTFGVKSFTDG